MGVSYLQKPKAEGYTLREMEIEKDPFPKANPRKRGGWKAIPYVLGNEAFEKLASMSLIANLTVFLSTKYNLEGIYLVNVVNIWSGTSNIVTIIGAFIADAYLGRYLTILYGSILSLLGMGIMTLTAGCPHLRPPPCHDLSNCQKPEKWQLGILFTGLGLLAAGSGCLRPCNVGFGADQFDTTTEIGRASLQRFFNYWYLSFTLALLIALTVVVYVQTSISWLIGFVIPTACLAISTVIFLMGRKLYVLKKPGGSVFVDIAKVTVASFKKRHVHVGDDVALFDPPSKGDAGSEGSPRMRHTARFKCLDKAALLINPNEIDMQGAPKSNWRLCSVHQVEQLKCLVGVIPVWFSGIGCFIAMDQQDSFGMLQAMQLNTSVGPNNFKIPPAWMSIIGMLSLAICIIIYEQLYVSRLSKCCKKGTRLSTAQRIMTGIVMSILCMLASGISEKQRRDAALKAGAFMSPVSIAVLIPQFVLSGLVNAFAGVALMEFFTVQLPESMRSVSGSIFFLSLSAASYLSSLIVNVVHILTEKKGNSPWLGGHDLNKNRLDYFYYIIAAFGVLNLAYFMIFAKHYVFSSDVSNVATLKSDLENKEGRPMEG